MIRDQPIVDKVARGSDAHSIGSHYPPRFAAPSCPSCQHLWREQAEWNLIVSKALEQQTRQLILLENKLMVLEDYIENGWPV